MMMVARGVFTLAGLNLWQSGIRGLWGFIKLRHGYTDDELWSLLRIKLVELLPDCEEWELQLIRAILVEEHNITLEEGKAWYDRYPNSTPLLDAMKELIPERVEPPM